MLKNVCIYIGCFLVYCIGLSFGADWAARCCRLDFFIFTAINVPIITFIFWRIVCFLDIFSEKVDAIRYGVENIIGSVISCVMVPEIAEKYLQSRNDFERLIPLGYWIGILIVQTFNSMIWGVMLCKSLKKYYENE